MGSVLTVLHKGSPMSPDSVVLSFQVKAAPWGHSPCWVCCQTRPRSTSSTMALWPRPPALRLWSGSCSKTLWPSLKDRWGGGEAFLKEGCSACVSSPTSKSNLSAESVADKNTCMHVCGLPGSVWDVPSLYSLTFDAAHQRAWNGPLCEIGLHRQTDSAAIRRTTCPLTSY